MLVPVKRKWDYHDFNVLGPPLDLEVGSMFPQHMTSVHYGRNELDPGGEIVFIISVKVSV